MKTRTFIAASLAVHARTITTPRLLIIRRAWLWTGFLAFAMIAFGPRPAQAAVTEAWVQRYGSEAASEDHAYKVVTDAAGNVIVAGTSTHYQTDSGSDMLVIKYSGAGVPLWTNRYDGWANAVAVDASGNVIVTGNSTIAYSGGGVPLWTNRYNGTASAVAVDGSSNVFVTGSSYSSGGIPDYATIAYSGGGVPLWTNRYDGPANSFDGARAVAVDGTGNVFVTGYSDSSGDNPDYATIAYSGAGVPLWTNRYSGWGAAWDIANAVAVDASGNVFVTGYSGFSDVSGASFYDYATIAYSGAGVPLWTNRYNGPANGSDQATAVAVDGSGKVFVTGSSYSSEGIPDYATIAYSGAGVPLWTNHYDGQASALSVDASGNVFVTGSSYGSGSATIAYSAAGVALWTNRNNGTASALSVDASGNVFVTGSSYGSGSDSDYATIAYSGAGVPLWTNRYGGRGAAWDIANAVAADASGNVFVAGYSVRLPGDDATTDYATIAYSSAGVPLWTNRYNGPGNNSDQATAVAVDRSGNVFVTGSSEGDYATIAYSGAGVPLWTNRYDGPENGSDEAIALEVDGSGNVFVTGTSGFPSGFATTISYSGAGVPLWTNSYNGQARALAVDASGNVFVTGWSGYQCHWGCIGGYYATIAYSGTGVPLWTNRYDGPPNGGNQPSALAVDASGNVFVTGSSVGSGSDYDYATIAYSRAGVPLWTNRYNGPENLSDKATAVAVNASGDVFVTGYSLGSESYYDYATIAYSGAGVPLWTNRYHGPDNISDQATAVAVDSSGNVFVTGWSRYCDFDCYGESYATIVYSGAGVPLSTNRYNGPYNVAELPQTKPSLAIGSDDAVYVTTSAGLSLPDFVTVKYVWQTQIAIQLLSTISPKVNLTLSGAPNSSWAIERAMELTGPWTNLSSLLIGPNGSAQLQDTNSPSPAGFYRARQP